MNGGGPIRNEYVATTLIVDTETPGDGRTPTYLNIHIDVWASQACLTPVCFSMLGLCHAFPHSPTHSPTGVPA